MQDIRLDNQIAALWRAKWIVLAAILLAAGATALYQSRRPPSYSAKALIRVGRVWKEPLEDSYVTTQRVNSPGFLAELAAKRGKSPDEIQTAVKAETVTAGPQKASYAILVGVTAFSASADEAGALARNASEMVISAHQRIFDESLSAHKERQRQMESALGSAAPGPERERLQRELDEVKSANTSPTVTQPTEIVEPIIPAVVAKAEMTRPIAESALMAGVIATGLIMMVSFLRESPEPAPAGAELLGSNRE